MRTGIKKAEPRKAPKAFQDQLTRLFGRNKFGDPNFIIVWGQTYTIRLGNVWANGRKGYKDRLVQHNVPCWVIMRWRSPREYGTPELYYLESYEPNTGVYITGEYPWKGRYEILQPLYHKRFEGGLMVLDSMPLDQILIDRVIPMIIKAQRMSFAERKAAEDLIREKEEKIRSQEMTDELMERLPVWYGPKSFAGQGCRTSVLDKKMHEIQQQWNRVGKTRFKKGFGQSLTEK